MEKEFSHKGTEIKKASLFLCFLSAFVVNKKHFQANDFSSLNYM